MENLNIALIGCGMIGREHIERIQNRIRNAKVVAVCDVFEEGAKKGAEIAGAGTKVYTDFNEAINDPDVNAVVVTTPGQFHKGPVLAAIKAGKPVFSEKPLANTAADGKEIVEAEMAGGKHLVQVGFMRRYDRGYRQVKELIDSGVIGDVVHVTHTENVAYWHYAHSYVRGNWHKTADSSPMILAKCCHDMDILSWLLGSRCRTVSSFGDLRYFREENAPAGSPARCTDGCPHSGSCPYYAPALYLDDNTPWPTALTALGPDQSYEARKKALEEGPYGKCVFHNDNDVVDHQVASLLFENGTTVAFTMCAFSDACDRTVKFMGTRGEIRASMDNNVIEVTQFGAGVRTGTTAVYTVKPGSTGHSGGDEGIMEEFVSILKGERENTNTIAQSVHSHVMAFAAEESRLTGRTVDVADFEKSVMA